MRGVIVNILRSDYMDCTRGGATSPARSKGRIVVVFDPAIRDGNYKLEECKDDPRFICLQVVRRWENTPNEYMHCVPLSEADTGRTMNGGNFVYTSDSRFSALSKYPLPVHDRIE